MNFRIAPGGRTSAVSSCRRSPGSFLEHGPHGALDTERDRVEHEGLPAKVAGEGRGPIRSVPPAPMSSGERWPGYRHLWPPASTAQADAATRGGTRRRLSPDRAGTAQAKLVADDP